MILFYTIIYKVALFREKILISFVVIIFIIMDVFASQIVFKTSDNIDASDATARILASYSPLFMGESVDLLKKSNTYEAALTNFYAKKYKESNINVSTFLGRSESGLPQQFSGQLASQLVGEALNIQGLNYYFLKKYDKSIESFLQAYNILKSDRIIVNINHLLVSKKEKTEADIFTSYLSFSENKLTFPVIHILPPYKLYDPSLSSIDSSIEIAKSNFFFLLIPYFLFLLICVLVLFVFRKIKIKECTNCKTPVYEPFNGSRSDTLCMKCFFITKQRSILYPSDIVHYEKVLKKKIRQEFIHSIILSIIIPGYGAIYFGKTIEGAISFVLLFLLPIFCFVPEIYAPAVANSFSSIFFTYAALAVLIFFYPIMLLRTVFFAKRNNFYL